MGFRLANLELANGFPASSPFPSEARLRVLRVFFAIEISDSLELYSLQLFESFASPVQSRLFRNYWNIRIKPIVSGNSTWLI
ncbi:hypothetical protein MUK42_33955 [Musa troglodytarum]|uniref:Uncharacterized protein n=1 Tax=Musa troglodytarum TaxID=320322 RepID=A0A9E7JAX1_9LILI|nr:hypothetical protein MUK42_33955 [Musa troglodytarum]